jgi:flavin-dependent dehydrogenase
MDATLLDEAGRAGATVMQAARVERIDAARGVVTVRDLTGNRVSELRSAHVILADGKSAWGEDRPPPTGDLGVKAHFTGVTGRSDTISLFGVRGHYVGLAPVEGGRWNVAMSVPAERVRGFRGRLDALFDRMMSENAGLRGRFRDAARVGDWLVSPLLRFGVRRSWPPKVIPVGNAAAALEPVGGEGMGLAMRSAELAAEAIDAALRRGVGCDVAGLRRQFDRLWRVRRAAARAVGLMMSSPRVSRLAVGLLRHNDHLAAPALATLGK